MIIEINIFDYEDVKTDKSEDVLCEELDEEEKQKEIIYRHKQLQKQVIAIDGKIVSI